MFADKEMNIRNQSQGFLDMGFRKREGGFELLLVRSFTEKKSLATFAILYECPEPFIWEFLTCFSIVV